MLIGSNIIIHATYPDHEDLRNLIEEQVPFVSAVSYVEILGYHMLTEQEQYYQEMFFDDARVVPPSQEVLDQAVVLCKNRTMTLGGALIAGTARTYNLMLITWNMQDFQRIEDPVILNPFETTKKALKQVIRIEVSISGSIVKLCNMVYSRFFCSWTTVRNVYWTLFLLW